MTNHNETAIGPLKEWAAAIDHTILRLESDRNTGQSLVITRDAFGTEHTLTFPELYAAAHLSIPDDPIADNGPYLHTSTLQQIADELDLRAATTLACDCTGSSNLPNPHCPICQGAGHQPWPELKAIASVLRDNILPN